MLDDNQGAAPSTSNDDNEGATGEPTAKKAAAKKTAAKKAPAKKAPAKKAAAAKKAPAKKAPAKKAVAEPDPTFPPDEAAPPAAAKRAAAKKTAAKKAPAKRATAKKSAAPEPGQEPTRESAQQSGGEQPSSGVTAPMLFQAPDVSQAAPRRRTAKKAAAAEAADESTSTDQRAEKSGRSRSGVSDTGASDGASDGDQQPRARQPWDKQTDDQQPGDQQSGDQQERQPDDEGSDDGEGGSRRRRRRGGRRRRKSGDSGGDSDQSGSETPSEQSGSGSHDADESSDEGGESSTTRRRRKRRRAGEDDGSGGDDPKNTVTRVRKARSPEDQITSLSGSTRLEAKKQRRREGREAGRRRAPIVSEAEFLARRESVERVMAIRQRDDLIQIGVLEDKVLVEHYVARESQTSLIGNVYLGRVQNVLPSMEAAFIDIGKGRNAVLYAGEVNWQSLGHKDGQPRKIESVLSSGQSILVQVTKDPIGHKGARLTSQVSLAGRFLVYVPDGTTSGISRKLPDTERTRLKKLLKEIVPDSAGVIVRTAAEGASEEELTKDVERLKARWEDIEKKSKGQGPKLLYGEPDLTLKVVRDLFTEDFARLVVQGDDAWDTVHEYVEHVAPDLTERLERYAPSEHDGVDLFDSLRIEEQIHKGLDRKVWLPSGGSLIIDRTEAMTVVDVNTGKFTGSGGNLEETVTKNNLEAAEEIVRQLRLRDIGGIIVVDFIDMVLESNRDLVLRRLVECLGRDRTRHQVAEVTSLGLVQMTRKRIGTGLLEAFSENCEHCQGRGVVIADAPVEARRADEEPRRSRRSRGRKDSGESGDNHNHNHNGNGNGKGAPSPKDVAAMAQQHVDDKSADASEPAEEPTESSHPIKPTSSAEATGSRKSGGSATPVEPAEPEAVEAAGTADEIQQSTEPEPEVAPEPAPPEPPKVVTRTRRRSASRPAGPPTSATPSTTPAAQAPEPSATTDAGSERAQTGGRVGVTDVPPMPEAGGPTEALGRVGSPPEDGAVEPGTTDAEPGAAPIESPEIPHVPIKKKGSRKRG